MRRNEVSIIFAFFECLFWSFLSWGHEHSLKAHVHGIGTVTIAADSDREAKIEFDIPADSILGFEHAAKSDKEKQVEREAFRKLKEQAATVVQFNTARGCRTTLDKVGMESESSEHGDLNISYSVSCQEAFSPGKIHIGLSSLFPKVKELKVQVMTSNSQTEFRIKSAQDDISL